jgi:uncharacterized membrane protein
MKRKSGSKKQLVLFIILSVLLVASVSAQSTGGLGALEDSLGIILYFFTSGYMKAILTIALAGLGVGMIANRGEQGMVKKFIPWFAACLIILSASELTSVVFKSDDSLTIEAADSLK